MDERIKCGICNDYFKEPTTLPCGHNFCMECISNQWDMELYEVTYHCPRCLKTFETRPELKTNEALSVVGDKLKKWSLQDIPDKMVAVTDPKIPKKPQPKLRGKVKAKEKLQEMRCVKHKLLLNFYCRDDEKCICEKCSISDHRGHNMVPAKEERKERELKVEEFLLKARAEICERELNMEKIFNTSDYIKVSSTCAVEANKRVFSEMKASLEKMEEELDRSIKEQEKALVTQAQVEERKQEQNILSLKEVVTDLETLCHIQEDFSYIMKSQPVIKPQEPDPVTIHVNENISFEFVTIAMRKVKEMLEEGCKHAVENIQKTVRNVQLVKASEENVKNLPTKPVQTLKPKTRQDFLKYACPVILDPDTAHQFLNISDENTKLTVKRQRKKSSPKRFDCWEQVLSKEGLKGGCFYWEVDWSGKGAFIGVALESICRKGEGVECGLGHNVNSWCLHCSNISSSAWHNDVSTTISINVFSPRIGIYLDYNAGSLAFYSVSDKMTLLHKFTSEKFPGPLYPAFGLGLGLGLQSWIKLHKLENT
ncbi:tripartite motif-containing protein 16-like protein [Hoplias malabaricus]|uniref:tripartite motif-containing protein 16-like protein n=1 Tax=Hoplias malabaricus TaxID=27720 RepID=UPI003462337B